MKKYNVAIVGATGMVGRTFLKVLEERKFPINNIKMLASERSKGEIIKFNQEEFKVEVLDENAFSNIDIALFSAGGDISKKYAPICAEQGVLVIDNSSAWRMDKEVPLVVPEVNEDAIFENKGIIANPNCSTIQVMSPLKVLDNLFDLERVVYTTYQSVSGSGMKGMRDLEEGVKGEEPKLYPYPIAFNCLPHIDVFLDNEYTKEEWKMIEESRKILKKDSLKVTATCVRVPVKYGHAVAVYAECKKDVDVKMLRESLASQEGIILVDDVKNNKYPHQREAEGKDEVFVGRVRVDNDNSRNVHMWVVADNIRKGAATNAVQIAERYIRRD